MKPEQLTLAREVLGLTQEQLAQVLDVHPRTVSKWERSQLHPSELRIGLLSGVLKHATSSTYRTTGAQIRQALHRGELLRALEVLMLFASGR